MRYRTVQCETWDMIAYKLLGNENEITRLITENSSLPDKVIFSAGDALEVPESVSKESTSIPPWRR